jgi:UDP-N-acetylglucosamine--N-acetylmuramyl-(pentapeptide) pyrophosphoryl-undecaprenol N-acetylglucosamine transferase
VGSPGGVEEQLVRRAGLPFTTVDSGQLRGRAPWAVAANAWRILRGVRQAHRLMHDFRPEVVLTTGAYVAVPVAIAARQARVPLLIYLPDLSPGLAIRWLSRLAQKVAVSFEPAAACFPGKAVVTGYPARAELVAAAADRPGARRRLGLQEGQPVLLVMGGSHGARSINRAVCAILPRLLERAQVVHITGPLDWPWVQQEGENLPPPLRSRYHPYVYLHEEMVDALAAADLMVNRAGASNLGELPAVGVPAVLVPYPHAGRHQHINAAFLAQRGAARVVEDATLARDLLPAVLMLLEDAPVRQRMAEAARVLARPDAAQRIVNLMAGMVAGATHFQKCVAPQGGRP